MQVASQNIEKAAQLFDTNRLSDALAAEIEGVDLSQPIDHAMKNAIYDALRSNTTSLTRIEVSGR